MSKFKLAALALLVVAGAAGAATQGTLGSTSTGTFTNTFNSSPRQVQVLNLVDAVVSPSSGNVNFIGGSSVGTTDKFCVVDTGAGAVQLKFTSANPKPGIYEYTAKSSAGVAFNYGMAVGPASGTTVGNDLDTTGYTVAAGTTVTAAASCGAGNVSKAITPSGGTPLTVGTAIYIDTITVVATPI